MGNFEILFFQLNRIELDGMMVTLNNRQGAIESGINERQWNEQYRLIIEQIVNYHINKNKN